MFDFFGSSSGNPLSSAVQNRIGEEFFELLTDKEKRQLGKAKNVSEFNKIFKEILEKKERRADAFEFLKETVKDGSLAKLLGFGGKEPPAKDSLSAAIDRLVEAKLLASLSSTPNATPTPTPTRTVVSSTDAGGFVTRVWSDGEVDQVEKSTGSVTVIHKP